MKTTKIRCGDGVTLTVPKWKRCDRKCNGWLHISDNGDGYQEIQRCDACNRFEDDVDARLAHFVECGCSWPVRAPVRSPKLVTKALAVELRDALKAVLSRGHDCKRMGGGDVERCATCIRAHAALAKADEL